MVKQSNVSELINEIKDFYCISDFKKEIFEWSFQNSIIENLISENQPIVIGHPIGSHKGSSLGDILPYTRIPEEIYNLYGIKSYIPSHFKDVFKYNPYVAGIDDNLKVWGSLGPFGTTVQRTCNVWGLLTKEFSPSLYFTNCSKRQMKRQILISCNSKTGGQIKNLELITEVLFKLRKELKYHLIQVATNDDPIIPRLDQYYFNLSFDQLVDVLCSSEYYIGVQNSLYHLAKALNINVIGILPETIDPYFVKLPFLTQCNYLETNMLNSADLDRISKWKNKVIVDNKSPEDSHHIGWLYPDVTHLTMSSDGTKFCPTFSLENLLLAVEDKLYPYANPILYDYYSNSEYWF